MSDKPIFYDSDVLICFLKINEIEILKELFSKVIISKNVKEELTNVNAPKNEVNEINRLIEEKFIEVVEIEVLSSEYSYYKCMINGFWSNGEKLGFGESSAMALAISNNGIVASNNLKDVSDICDNFNIPIITSSLIVSFSFELGSNSKNRIKDIWNKIIKNTNKKLPKKIFDEYYEELFEKDCCELLKNYDFKKIYCA